MTNYGKVEVSPNRLNWNPTPLLEQVVLVTTIDKKEKPHVATKSRISVISYGPPTILVFACRAEYHTASNIRDQSQFVINVPGDDLTATSWVIGSDSSTHGPQLFKEHGLTPIKSIKVQVPQIAECRAHIECELEEMRQFGPDVAVFGKIVSVSMNNDIIQNDKQLAYQKLAPFFFLDTEWTASLSPPRRVEEPIPGPRHNLTILATENLEKTADFYTRAFDWPIRTRNNRYVEFEIPGGRGLGISKIKAVGNTIDKMPHDNVGNSKKNVALYFHCDDLPRAIARLVSAGAHEVSALKDRDWGDKTAFFADPDGNIIATAIRQESAKTK